MTKDLPTRLKDFSASVSFSYANDYKFKADNINSIFIDKPYLSEDLHFFEKARDYCLKNEISLYLIDSNVMVPVRVASAKEEYSAMTLRRKIHKVIEEFTDMVLTGSKETIAENEAFKTLEDFIQNKIDHYDIHNDPSKDYTSGLSVYLKYGFISPVTIYNKIKSLDSDNIDDFIEELIVRRELAYQ